MKRKYDIYKKIDCINFRMMLLWCASHCVNDMEIHLFLDESASAAMTPFGNNKDQIRPVVDNKSCAFVRDRATLI